MIIMDYNPWLLDIIKSKFFLMATIILNFVLKKSINSLLNGNN